MIKNDGQNGFWIKFSANIYAASQFHEIQNKKPCLENTTSIELNLISILQEEKLKKMVKKML